MGPLIAIAGNLGQINGWDTANATTQCVGALERGGGTPFIVPPTKDEDALSRFLDLSSALFLPGGSDVQPLLYGHPPHPMLGAVQPDLDKFQIALIQMALQRKMPLFGVCRGIQILNVALGGTLIQHIPAEAPYIQHLATTHKRWNVHEIEATPGSLLAENCGIRFQANSYHHQAPDRIAPDLFVSGKAEDGIVEALEHRSLPFVLAVQWHPECMLQEDDRMLPLFSAFIAAAQSYESQSSSVRIRHT